MSTVNMLEAKSQLSRLIQSLEDGEEREIIIARNNRPAARLTLIAAEVPPERRIGVAAGCFVMPADTDTSNDQVRRLFEGSGPT